MITAFQVELRKFLSTRLWWLLLIVLAAYMAFMGVVMAFTFTADSPQGGAMDLAPVEIAKTVYSLGNSLGYVFPLVIGALAVTTEFRHQTITATFIVEPRRTVVLVAKFLAGAVIGVAYGAAGTAATVVGGAPLLAWQGDGARLGDGDVLTAIALTIVSMTMWTMIGVGFGAVLTSQMASIVVLLAFTQFVEPLLRAALGAVDALAPIGRFLPGSAAESIAGASIYSAMGVFDLLERWQGALVMLAYVLIFGVIGRLTSFKRDVS